MNIAASLNVLYAAIAVSPGTRRSFTSPGIGHSETKVHARIPLVSAIELPVKVAGTLGAGLTPELSRPAKRVRLGRTVMRAKVNPKPAARNGAGRVGSTGKASEGTEQIEAGKGRSQQRRQSERHEAILVPSGANAMHPKPSEARPGNISKYGASATDQRRSQWCSRSRSITEVDNTNTPTHA